MMDFLRNWLVGIVAAGIAAALAGRLSPPGVPRRVAQIAGGLVVLLTVIRPLATQALWQNLSMPDDLRWQTERSTARAQEAGQRVMKKIIETETSAYIENEAKTRGLSLRAAVEAETPPGGETPLPARVHLITNETPDQQNKSDFAEWLTSTLDIPPDCQRWEEGG